MALTPEDLEMLGAFIENKIEQARPVFQAAEGLAREVLTGRPDTDPLAGPEFYVHLADGSVITTHDSSSTHMAGKDGNPVIVIGRYQKGQ
jgi:hypothetical protein